MPLVAVLLVAQYVSCMTVLVNLSTWSTNAKLYKSVAKIKIAWGDMNHAFLPIFRVHEHAAVSSVAYRDTWRMGKLNHCPGDTLLHCCQL